MIEMIEEMGIKKPSGIVLIWIWYKRKFFIIKTWSK